MNIQSFIHFILLAAIWGASFPFMKIAAPVLGPALFIEARVLLASIFLLVVTFCLKKTLNITKYWKQFFIVGLFNSAIPFLTLAYASQTLSASLVSVLNATAPIWAATIGVFLKRIKLSFKLCSGLILGFSGVIFLVGIGDTSIDEDALFAIMVGLLAAVSYGIASTYTQITKKTKPIEAQEYAHGSMWFASIMVAPLITLAPLPTMASIEFNIFWAVLSIGIVCTGIAFLLYFRLIEDIGASSALSVIFLVPVFSMIWGVVFLEEEITQRMIIGTVMVIGGASLILNVLPLPKPPENARAQKAL